MMDAQAMQSLCLMAGAAAMIAARRWQNNDRNAGVFIALGTFILLIIVLWPA